MNCTCMWNETPDDVKGNLAKSTVSPKGKKSAKHVKCTRTGASDSQGLSIGNARQPILSLLVFIHGDVMLSYFRTAVLLGLLAVSQVSFSQVEITDPPESHNFGKVPIGATYATQYFSAFNRGTAAVTLGTVTVDAGDILVCLAIGCPTIAPLDFVVSTGVGCTGAVLNPGEGCSTLVSFTPTSVGERLARLVIPVVGSTAITRRVAGTGTAPPLDCVLDWAEREFKTVLTGPTSSFLISPFYARCYQGGALCLAADMAVPSFAPPSVYVYQNQTLASLGRLSEFAALAQCN